MNFRQMRSCFCEACSERHHTEEVVAYVFVVSKGMRSTCAECRSLCLQCLEHLSIRVCNIGRALPQLSKVDARVRRALSEVLQANQDSFL